MPPPMVPPPMIAMLLMSRTGVSFGKPFTFAASRSAKKAWRIAADWGETTNSVKSSRSFAKPSSIGRFTAASIQLTIRSWAICPRALFANFLRAASKNPAGTEAGSIFISRTRFNGALLFISSFAYAKPATSKSSPSTTLSTKPEVCAFLAAIGLPEVIKSKAASTPIKRGALWVPPAPGKMPSFTSGKPTFAVGNAQR